MSERGGWAERRGGEERPRLRGAHSRPGEQGGGLVNERQRHYGEWLDSGQSGLSRQEIRALENSSWSSLKSLWEGSMPDDTPLTQSPCSQPSTQARPRIARAFSALTGPLDKALVSSASWVLTALLKVRSRRLLRWAAERASGSSMGGESKR